jgi:predicted permease
MASILNILAPIFLIIALGALLRVTRFAPPEFFRGTNRLVYWVAMPCALFYQTAEARIEGGAAFRVFATLVIAGFTCMALASVVGRGLRVQPRQLGSFVQGSFRGNVAFVGLPVITLTFAQASKLVAADVAGLAVLAIAFLIPIYNLATVALFTSILRPETASRSAQLRSLLRDVITNPLVVSSLAGLLFSFAGWPLPPIARQTLKLIGDMTTPLALISIGAGLALVSARAGLALAAAAALIKVGVAPLVGYLVAPHIGLTPVELRVAMIFLACPTASASYIMAQMMGADDTLAGTIILASTVLSFPALSVVLLAT